MCGVVFGVWCWGDRCVVVYRVVAAGEWNREGVRLWFYVCSPNSKAFVFVVLVDSDF